MKAIGICAVVLFFLAAGCGYAADTPPPANILGPASTMETYLVGAGSTAGYQIGDHLRIRRNGKALGQAVITRISPNSAEAVLIGQAVATPQKGDTVEFVRRRQPLPSIQPTAPGPRAVIANQPATLTPTDWKEVGTVSGLLGNDWMTRNTTTCVAWVRKEDLAYMKSVVDGLDTSYDMNSRYTGVEPRLPMTFYFCPLADPAHTQPRFQQRLAAHTRFAGIALPDLNTCLVNLGNWRTSQHYEPWEVEKTCRHEMNHLFVYTVRGADRMGTWHWLFEALAHTIEDTARPASVRLDLPSLKAYMSGYSSVDASWAALINDRDNDSLEQYRQYNTLLISIIFFLRDKFGQDAVSRLMLAARGQDIEDALTQTFGRGVVQLEADWKQYYGIQ